MTFEEFKTKAAQEIAGEFTDVLKLLAPEDSEKQETIEENLKQYNLEHKILDRDDKTVGTGENQRLIETWKLVVPFQKKIVNLATAFLFGSKVNLVLDSEENESTKKAFRALKRVWKKCKLDYHNRELARTVFSETRAAELFYIEKLAEEKKIRALLLSKKKGDDIYPHFNEYGNLVAFTRKYKVKSGDGKTVERVDIYTDEYVYQAIKGENDWEVTKEPNLIKKIPVIYYEQEAAEWSDVQSLIERVEDLISKTADTNDYFASPAVVSKGKLKTAPEKGEVGKFFQLLPEKVDGKPFYGDLEYLTWDSAPENIKQEYDILKDLINYMTASPDLSFNNVKGVSDLSGIAMKFMFFDSILKAQNKEEIFGEGLERRINLLKQIMSVANVNDAGALKELEISVEFQEALPENIQEMVEMLSVAVGGKPVISQEGAVKRNPMVENAEKEIENLKEESKQAQNFSESYE